MEKTNIKSTLLNKIILKILFTASVVAMCIMALKVSSWCVSINGDAYIQYMLEKENIYYMAAVVLGVISVISTWFNLSIASFLSSFASCVGIAAGIGISIYDSYTYNMNMIAKKELNKFDLQISNGIYFIGGIVLLVLIISIINICIKKSIISTKFPKVVKQTKCENEDTDEVEKTVKIKIEKPCFQIDIKAVWEKAGIPIVSIICAVAIVAGIVILKSWKSRGNEDLFSCGLLAVSENGEDYGYINKKGTYVINPQFDYAYSFASNGLALVKNNGEYGYINEKGKYVINPQFDDACSFGENGLAAVKSGDKWGYINKKGAYVINPQFDYAYNFSKNGIAMVGVKSEEKTTTSSSSSKSTSSKSSKSTTTTSKYGYINEKGKYVINPQFDNACSFGENGLAAVKSGDKWGYINKKGAYVINPQFDYAYNFSKSGIAMVGVKSEEKTTSSSSSKSSKSTTTTSKYGYINEKGEYVINPQFDDAYSFGKNGLAAVKSGDKWGYINNKGTYVINPQFDFAYTFAGKGLAVVENEDKCGYIHKSGRFVINPQFNFASRLFDDGYALVYNGKEYGVINTKGTYVINPMYKNISIEYYY